MHTNPVEPPEPPPSDEANIIPVWSRQCRDPWWSHAVPVSHLHL